MRQISRGRDESWVEGRLKVLMQVLLNFSMCIIMALVIFVIGLGAVLRLYQPNRVVVVLLFWRLLWLRVPLSPRAFCWCTVRQLLLCKAF
jgi:hypothetical protein